MRDIFALAWQRFNVIMTVIGDVQGRLITTVFYFTVLAPFGVGSRIFSDPLRKRVDSEERPVWLERDPIARDLDSAKRQG